MKIIENFLSPEEFDKTKDKSSIQGNRMQGVFANLQSSDFVRPVLFAAQKKLEELADLEVQQMLLRFENKTGLLHHDLNKAPHRKFSLLYYMEEPTKGGEIIFPFFSSINEPTTNLATERCGELFSKGTFYSQDAEIEKYIIDNKEKLLTVKPKGNMAILFSSSDKSSWHFVCPVEEGLRSCFSIFYQKKGVENEITASQHNK